MPISEEYVLGGQEGKDPNGIAQNITGTRRTGQWADEPQTVF